MKKDVKKFITSTLKQVDKNNFEASSENVNDHVYDVIIRVLRQVCAVNISVFQSLLEFLTFPGSKSKQKSKFRKWSLVAKLMHKGVIACEERQVLCVNELESVDDALCSGVLGDGEKIQTAHKKLEALENSIYGLEIGLDSVFRRLIKTRTSLLNIISQ